MFWFLEDAASVNKAERRPRLLGSGGDAGKAKPCGLLGSQGKAVWTVAGKAEVEERPGGRFEFR